MVTLLTMKMLIHTKIYLHISILSTVNSAFDIQERLEMETVAWQDPFSSTLKATKGSKRNALSTARKEGEDEHLQTHDRSNGLTKTERQYSYNG